MKKNIIAARENKCKFCDGTVYKLKTSKGIFYQCSCCGSLCKINTF
ncbi:hypothetical protein [Romboutsia sp. 1001216sp1]